MDFMDFFTSLGYGISFAVVFIIGLVFGYLFIKIAALTLAVIATIVVLQIRTPFAISTNELYVQGAIYLMAIVIALVVDCRSFKNRCKQIDDDFTD